jgi:hypothetical protein
MNFILVFGITVLKIRNKVNENRGMYARGDDDPKDFAVIAM